MMKEDSHLRFHLLVPSRPSQLHTESSPAAHSLMEGSRVYRKWLDEMGPPMVKRDFGDNRDGYH